MSKNVATKLAAFVGPVVLLGAVVWWWSRTGSPPADQAVRSVPAAPAPAETAPAPDAPPPSTAPATAPAPQPLLAEDDVSGLSLASVRRSAAERSVWDAIERTSRESNHRIEDLPMSDRPLTLRLDVAAEPVGTVKTSRAVVLQQNGSESTGFVMLKRAKVQAVDAASGKASLAASSGTVMLGGLSSDQAPTRFDVVSEEQYTVAADGSTEERDVVTKIGLTTVTQQKFQPSLTRLPVEAKPGQSSTTVLTPPDDAPEKVRRDPPRVDVTYVKPVRFNGVDAALVRVASTGYHVTNIVPPNGVTIKQLTKVATEYRYYADVATGRRLWGESKSTIVEADDPRVVGSTTVYREEPVSQ